MPADPTLGRKTNSGATSGSFVADQLVAGRFRIVRLLARGGMGEVYEAEDLELRERVALKAVRQEAGDDEQADALFKREIQLARKVTHPNVCRTFDSVRHAGTLLVTMELLQGETLAERLKRTGAMTAGDAQPLVGQMAGALQAAHDAGVIHRDFKSPNVMLAAGASGTRAVVTDFGLARGATVVGADGQAAAQATSAFIGTPEYMSPEQVEGGVVTPAVDVYALGVVMYEMVTGRCPFTGTTPLEIMVRRLKERPTPPRVHAAGLDPRWEAVILRCLERDPKDRFASAADVPRALGGASVAAPAGASARRRRIRLALTVAALLTAFGLFVSRDRPRATPALAAPVERTWSVDVPTTDERGAVRARERRETSGYSEDLGEGVTLDMVPLRGGSFSMGSLAGEPMRHDDEGPQHQVSLRPFAIGRFEVTQAQWRQVAQLPRIARDLPPDPARFKGDARPVEQISWNDAVEFCARLSRRTSRAYRLPSEAEWEYACRAGTGTPFAFGPNVAAAQVNYNAESPYGAAPRGTARRETTPVGGLGAANAFGLFDMHGNVWEWCQDSWHPSYAGAPGDGSAWETPTVASRLLRGGSWANDADNSRSAHRDAYPASGSFASWGFRVVGPADVGARTR